MVENMQLVESPKSDYDTNQREDFKKKVEILKENGINFKEITLPNGLDKYLNMEIKYDFKEYGDEVVYWDGMYDYDLIRQVNQRFKQLTYLKPELDFQNLNEIKKSSNEYYNLVKK